MISSNVFQGESSNIDDVADYLLETSTQEFCENKSQLLLSNTTERILRIAGMQMNKEAKQGAETDIERVITLYKTVFEKKGPITKEEIIYLGNFFRGKKILPAINKILSKISIQQSDDNKKFIRDSLENKHTEKYDASGLLDHILNELAIQDELVVYPFIVNIDLTQGEKIECVKETVGVGKIYYYMETSGKYKLFFIPDNLNTHRNKKIVYLKEIFEQKPGVLGNGLLLGIEERGTSRIGVLYKFDPETQQLQEVYQKEGLVSIEELDNNYGFFQTKNETGQKGVLKIIEADTGEWKISEILQELYEKIYMGPNGLIVTEREDKELQEDDTIITTTLVGLYIEAWDENIYPENKLTGRILQSWFGKEPTGFSDNSPFNIVDFFDRDNRCCVSTTEGYNYYTINKDQQTITPINGLQGLKAFNDDSFFKGNIPTLIEEQSGKLFVKAFDTETNTVKDLIEIQSKTYPVRPARDINQGNMIELNFYSKTTVYAYFHEGKLYGIKEGFDVRDGDIYKTRFLRSAKDLGIHLDNDFDKVSQFLEEIRTPRQIIIL